MVNRPASDFRFNFDESEKFSQVVEATMWDWLLPQNLSDYCWKSFWSIHGPKPTKNYDLPNQKPSKNILDGFGFLGNLPYRKSFWAALLQTLSSPPKNSPGLHRFRTFLNVLLADLPPPPHKNGLCGFAPFGTNQKINHKYTSWITDLLLNPLHKNKSACTVHLYK